VKLSEIRDRDAQFGALDMKWSGTPEATKDRRELLRRLDVAIDALRLYSTGAEGAAALNAVREITR